jgi:hypothetical protein
MDYMGELATRWGSRLESILALSIMVRQRANFQDGQV